LFLVSAIFHHISLLRLLPKSYIKISTFQPNFLCSSYFKTQLWLSILSRKVNRKSNEYRKHILLMQVTDKCHTLYRCTRWIVVELITWPFYHIDISKLRGCDCGCGMFLFALQTDFDVWTKNTKLFKIKHNRKDVNKDTRPTMFTVLRAYN